MSKAAILTANAIIREFRLSGAYENCTLAEHQKIIGAHIDSHFAGLVEAADNLQISVGAHANKKHVCEFCELSAKRLRSELEKVR